jgi:hypothetical protein
LADAVVERLVELYKKLEAVKDGSVVKGWHPLRFDSNGRVVAGKVVDGNYRTNDFEPVGEWKKAAEYLELEGEFRLLLFSDLTPEQVDAYRAGVGLPPATRQKADTQ